MWSDFLDILVATCPFLAIACSLYVSQASIPFLFLWHNPYLISLIYNTIHLKCRPSSLQTAPSLSNQLENILLRLSPSDLEKIGLPPDLLNLSEQRDPQLAKTISIHWDNYDLQKVDLHFMGVPTHKPTLISYMPKVNLNESDSLSINLNIHPLDAEPNSSNYLYPPSTEATARYYTLTPPTDTFRVLLENSTNSAPDLLIVNTPNLLTPLATSSSTDIPVTASTSTLPSDTRILASAPTSTNSIATNPTKIFIRVSPHNTPPHSSSESGWLPIESLPEISHQRPFNFTARWSLNDALISLVETLPHVLS